MFIEGADAEIDVSTIFTIRTACGGTFSETEEEFAAITAPEPKTSDTVLCAASPGVEKRLENEKSCFRSFSVQLNTVRIDCRLLSRSRNTLGISSSGA